MEALINDSETQDLDILLIQEPLSYQHLTHVQHQEWTCYQPTSQDDTAKPRSLMYINKRFSTSTHHQVPCHSPGVTAAELQASTQTILLFSVYILPIDKVVAIDEERLRRITQAMRDTIEAHERDRDTGPGHGTGHNNGR